MGNYDGHGKVSHNNVFAFPHVYGTTCFWNWNPEDSESWFPIPGYEERFYNNSCLMGSGSAQNYISMPKTCDFGNASSIAIHTHSNRVFSPGKNVSVSGCGRTISFEEWMALGVDPGSTIDDLPDDDGVVAMGLAVLGLSQ